MQTLILDTNVVLDAFVFGDASTQPLLQALHSGAVSWLATPAMRDELARVLHYPHLVRRLAGQGLEATAVLACFDRHTCSVAVPARASVSCSDPDDQKYIDLAVAHPGWLLSRDRALLRLRKRLAGMHVRVAAHWIAAH